MDVARIQLLLLDVDGVLTDGRISVDDHGVETKHFHVRDGAGIALWRRLGLQVGVLTGRITPAVTHRALELGLGPIEHAPATAKTDAYEKLRHRLGLSHAHVAYMGDDLPDVPVLRRAGYPITVADGVPEARDAARFVTTLPGGRGAVREAIEHLLKETGRWQQAHALYDIAPLTPAEE